MISLIYPDVFHLEAAAGWLLLGNHREAAAEFQKLSRPYEWHPEYLHVQCRLFIYEKNWEKALQIGRKQVWLAPEMPQGWLNQAYCLHELKRTREALDLLLPAARRFPKHDLIAYNLACYCCHLQKFKAALAWINRTMDLLGTEEE